MVKNLTDMLNGATNFDSNINIWQISKDDIVTNMITDTSLATDQLFGFTNDIVPNINLFNKPICFNKGTKILCYKNNEEVYIPVEQLKSGDLVKTYLHGYKPIYMIKKGVFTLSAKGTMGMYKMKKTGAMIDDLEMTGLHAQLIDEDDKKYKKDQERQASKVDYYNKFIINANNRKMVVKENDKYDKKKVYIDDKYRLLVRHSSDFKKMCSDEYEIYTFSLDEQLQYGIWANGVLVETTTQRVINKN